MNSMSLIIDWMQCVDRMSTVFFFTMDELESLRRSDGTWCCVCLYVLCGSCRRQRMIHNVAIDSDGIVIVVAVTYFTGSTTFLPAATTNTECKCLLFASVLR